MKPTFPETKVKKLNEGISYLEPVEYNIHEGHANDIVLLDSL